jgi:tetratricopeptide (TPR) repeat protein
MSFRFSRLLGPVIGALALAATLVCSSVLHAENEGQEDLDQATEKKLSADSLDDLSQVTDLCESALKKGLDATNTQFANNLLTGTLLQRANILSKTIVEKHPQGWAQLRVLALADLEKALKTDPNLAAADLMIARLQLLPGGDKAAAMKAAQQAFDLSKEKPEEQVAALVLQADLSDDAAKKLDYFNQALKIAPNNQEALRQRGTYYLVTGKIADAAADLNAAAKAEPDNPEIQEARGLALLMLKRFDEAIDAFSAESTLMPDEPMPYLHRARAYAAEKKTQDALDDIDRAIKAKPDSTQHVGQALLLRAQVHQQASNNKAALADLDEALKNAPGWAPALELRAIISAGSKNYSQAIDDLQELKKVSPMNSDLQIQIAALYEANKQPRKAIAIYNDLLTANPDNFVALRSRGDSYLNIGKHAEAVTDYEAALKLEPNDTGLLNNLAWVLATSPEDSVRNGKRSVELGTQAAKLTDYKKAFILSTLAAGYAESGDFDKAREWSQKAVDLGTEDDEVNAQLKKELSSYGDKKPWREKQVVEEKEDAAGSDNNSARKKLPGPPPLSDGDTAAAKDSSGK